MTPAEPTIPAGAEAMREAAAAWHDEQARLLREDADRASSVGMDVSDSCGCLRHYASLHEGHAAALRALPLPAAEKVQAGFNSARALAWLVGDTRLSLYHYAPIYGDDDDQREEWRVDRESGNINDREWTTIGRGSTPLDALRAAAPAYTPRTPEPTGDTREQVAREVLERHYKHDGADIGIDAEMMLQGIGPAIAAMLEFAALPPARDAEVERLREALEQTAYALECRVHMSFNHRTFPAAQLEYDAAMQPVARARSALSASDGKEGVS